MDNKSKRSFKIEKHNLTTLLLVIYDIVAVNGAYFIGLLLRYDFDFSRMPREYLLNWLHFVPIYTAISLLCFVLLRLYRSLWRFASYDELVRVMYASVITGVCHTILISLIFGVMPLSYYLVGMGIQFLLIAGVRFSYRFLLLAKRNRECTNAKGSNRVMLIGAGEAGQLILRDIHGGKSVRERVCCIIDDDHNKWGRYIDGVPIVGGRDDILLNAKKYKIGKIYLAIPGASAIDRRDILNVCKETDCELKNLPSVYQFVNSPISANSLKEVNIEDLLGREPINVQTQEIYDFISGKVILVTGGGGSIGSELCRQIASHNPKQLIVFDIYENNAHSIALELKDKYPGLNLEVLIGSVRDSRRINQVFQKYRPEIVYHAAAHKHVPLMEDSPCESIKNNAIGTYKTAYAAMLHGCRRFVLISTDKAVNPTNIMGASKRLCEMVIQSFDRKIREGRENEILPFNLHSEEGCESGMQPGSAVTEFVAVRFGNVLGSNGSVIPRFKEQIAKGGPVTVTHPDIIRYFMTIPEAASLVLQAGTYAKGGEIFVLDMGSPVKIDTLARNLIRLSGLKPGEDIEISYTGLRPGEKLYEEKLMLEEGLRTTPNRLIHIGCPIPFDADSFLVQLQRLMEVSYDGRDDLIRQMVAEIVTTYHPAGEGGCEEKSEAFMDQLRAIDEASVKV